jgi:tRNA(Phe) wybutosine-synthesizing methylase Tyw3
MSYYKYPIKNMLYCKAVHELKEKLKKETEGLKRLKEQLQELTERQKNEREVKLLRN